MNFAAVMDELGTALETIDGLRVSPYWADRVTPPAVVITWPDSYEFDQTMQRGADKVAFPVLVVVGKVDARSSRNQLSQYVSGSGTGSVKAAIESHTPTSYSSARVASVEFGAVTIAGTSYLSATFDIEVIAPGEVS